MMANRSGVFYVLIFGLLTAGLCGCDRKLSSFDPFATPVAEEHGFTTPAERILSLQELRKKASKTTDPGERESICGNWRSRSARSPIRSFAGRSFAPWRLTAVAPPMSCLRAAVHDTDTDVRVIVCELWGRRHDAEAAQVLAGVLGSDSDRDVRMAAARGMGHSHEAVVRPLGLALDDPDPAMRHTAMVALRDSTGQEIGTDPGDVDHWRQYVKSGEVTPKSLAERLFWWYY